MAVVRELITVLGASVDQAGFKQYETGIERLKSLALSIGKAFGIAFSADKIIEFADELVTAGKEINKIRIQLNLIARPIDDMDVAQQKVFETAQQLRVAYKDVFETFKQFSTEMRETEIPQDQILKTTQNIYEALRVERADPEKIEQVMQVFERTFKRGAMRSVGVGQLFGLSPEIFSMLEKAFKTDEEGLRALAKEGKITAEAITQAFGVANKELDEKFAKVPIKIGDAFTVIKNDLIELTAQVYKLTEMSSFFGRTILYVWNAFRNVVVETTKAMGGLKNVVELLGYVLGVALGPWLIMSLTRAVALTIAWASANALLLIQWVAIGAAVLGVALAIQDVVYWMQNKHSTIGTWVGPFSKLSENFKKLDIFSGFRLFSDAFKGDWESFKKDWAIFMDSTPAKVALISAAILGIGGAFVAITFFMKEAITIMKLFGSEAVIAADKAKVAAGVEGVAGAKGKGAVGPNKAGPRVANLLTLGLLGWDAAETTGLVNSGIDKNRISAASTAALIGSFFGPWGTAIGAAGGFVSPEIKGGVDTATRKYHEADKVKPEAIDSDQQSPKLPKISNQDMWGFFRGLAERMYYGPDAIRNQNAQPAVAPGALGPRAVNNGPVNNSVNPTLNQTNNIKVETTLDAAQIGQIVGDRVTSFGEKMLNGYTRNLQLAGPRVEKATQ